MSSVATELQTTAAAAPVSASRRAMALPRVLLPMGDMAILVLTMGFGVSVAGHWFTDATLDANPGSLAFLGPFVGPVRLALLCGMYLFFLSRAGLYRRDHFAWPRRAAAGVLWASLEAFVAVAALTLLFSEIVPGRRALLFHGLAAVPMLAVWRMAAGAHFGLRPDPRPTVVLGSNKLGVEVANALRDHEDNVVGLIRVNADDAPSNFPVIGNSADLLELCKQHGVRRLVLAPCSESSGNYPLGDIMTLRRRGVEVESGVNFYEEYTGRVLCDVLSPDWWVQPADFRRSAPEQGLERTLNVIFGVTVLTLLSPFLAIVAALIKLDSKGPILYAQERVGLGGRSFRMLKFRSMRTDAEAKSGPVWCQENDPRVTRMGRIMRRTRIDELPQFWNVVRGDMSFIGPRPERPHFVEQLESRVPNYQFRHLVRPGITGWAQVNHTYTSSEEDTATKLLYDLYYVKRGSARLAIEVILGSVITVITGRGAR